MAVWQLGWSSDLEHGGELEVSHSLSGINYWQKAQYGFFTELVSPSHLDLARYLRHIGKLDHLTKLVLPARDAFVALRNLAEMNITFSRLYPDLRGAAMEANLGAMLNMLGIVP